MPLFILLCVCVVLFLIFKNARKKGSKPNTHSSVDENSAFEKGSMQERAESSLAENSILGGIINPSPAELEKQVNFARPLMQPISNSTSLFDADKVDDLTRPWGEELAGESTNLFELDKEHDLTKPWGES